MNLSGYESVSRNSQIVEEIQKQTDILRVLRDMLKQTRENNRIQEQMAKDIATLKNAIIDKS